jgi:hypothetical protein
VPETDFVPIMKQNIYSATIDQTIVDGATELLTYGADPKIGWFDKPYAPKELYDLTLLKEVAPALVQTLVRSTIMALSDNRHHAARTAFQVLDTVLSLTRSLPSLN